MRCNAGIPPSCLLDQHLIAEYRELLIPLGQQKRLNFSMKSPAPLRFKLGAGHILFWRDKHLYLQRRHKAVVVEMIRRGFVPNLSYWSLSEVPQSLCNDWQPSYEDSLLVRERIAEKVRLKPTWYRYKGSNLTDASSYISQLFSAPVEF